MGRQKFELADTFLNLKKVLAQNIKIKNDFTKI